MKEINEEPRALIRLRLIGGPDGAIPLAQLAAMADLQQAVFRLAKSIEGRAGKRGRSPQMIEELSRLLAVGIEAGSAVLEINAPTVAGQLPLSDVGLEALNALEDALETLSRGDPLGTTVDEWSQEGIGSFLSGLSAYESIELEDRRADSVRRIAVQPNLARRAIQTARLPSATTDNISGKLYELNVNTGTYRIEDDLGRSHLLDFDSTPNSLEHVRPLIGRRVVAQGTKHSGSGIRKRFRATTLELAEAPPQADFYGFDLARALQETHPVKSVADLRIDNFDDEEAELFWNAISE